MCCRGWREDGRVYKENDLCEIEVRRERKRARMHGNARSETLDQKWGHKGPILGRITDWVAYGTHAMKKNKQNKSGITQVNTEGKHLLVAYFPNGCGINKCNESCFRIVTKHDEAHEAVTGNNRAPVFIKPKGGQK